MESLAKIMMMRKATGNKKSKERLPGSSALATGKRTVMITVVVFLRKAKGKAIDQNKDKAE